MKLLLWFCLLVCSVNVLAHKASDSYLSIQVKDQLVSGQWDIALRDLDFALGLDSNGDNAITWKELKDQKDPVFNFALNHLYIYSNRQRCQLKPLALLVEEHSDGHYAVLTFNTSCQQIPQQLSINYRLFFDIDAQHRGLLSLHHHEQTDTFIFSPEHSEYDSALTSSHSAWQELHNFGYEGIRHIWLGYDHILFLLSLLLPAALVQQGKSWQVQPSIKKALWDVLAVVTAFTLAHSLTLSLAALGYISLPSRWVESAIAASVCIAALNNIYPLFTNRRTWFAFGFGLIHGMGIASVLLDMGLPDGQRLMSLFGFNIGVELGQLAIVAIAFPVITWLSRNSYYPALVLRGGSAFIATVGFIWLAERSLDLQMNIF